MLVNTKAKIGVFSIALGAYLPQFPQLVPNFEAQYEDFKKTIPDTVDIVDGGMVTTKEQAMAAGDKFRAADVDLVFLQLLTYATSYNVLPAIRDLDVPVVCINVQKKLAPDYANTDIPIWLGDLYACGAVGGCGRPGACRQETCCNHWRGRRRRPRGGSSDRRLV